MTAFRCETCGHDFASRLARQGHMAGCWPGHPNPPKRRWRNLACQTCTLRHTPHCVPGPRAWPVAALLAKVGGSNELTRRLGWADSRGYSGDLSDAVADRWAVACGLHPEQVWPGWIAAGLTERDHRFVNHGGWRQSWLYLERLRAAADLELAS